MRRIVLSAGAATLAVTVAFAPASIAQTNTTLNADLSGKQEKPSGDSNGSGTARIQLNPSRGRVCYTINVKGINGMNAAHIHQGKKGVSGNVVVPFFGSTTKASSKKGCVKNVDKALIQKIAKTPANYYVNVHNKDYPNGAIRGQLKK